MNEKGKRQARLIFKQLGVLDGMAGGLGSIRTPDAHETGVAEELKTLRDTVASMRNKLVQMADGAGLYEEPDRIEPSNETADGDDDRRMGSVNWTNEIEAVEIRRNVDGWGMYGSVPYGEQVYMGRVDPRLTGTAVDGDDDELIAAARQHSWVPEHADVYVKRDVAYTRKWVRGAIEEERATSGPARFTAADEAE